MCLRPVCKLTDLSLINVYIDTSEFSCNCFNLLLNDFVKKKSIEIFCKFNNIMIIEFNRSMIRITSKYLTQRWADEVHIARSILHILTGNGIP